MAARIKQSIAIAFVLFLGLAQFAQAQFPALIEASEIANGDGSRGFIMQGESEGSGSGLVLGSGVSAVGDIDADGRDDFAISSAGADPNGNDSGRLLVVFGRDAAFPNPFDLTALDGSDGFVINGESSGEFFGSPVRAAGDLNDDGIDDLAACGPWASPNGPASGRCYVVFGDATGFSAALELSALDGSNGFAINGEAASDLAGFSLSPAGDFNADGLADLLVGALRSDSNGVNSGRAYIVYGNTTGYANPLELSALNGVNGVILNGQMADERAGIRLARINDINNDGFDDIAIDASVVGGGLNRSYVVYGDAAGLSSPFELSALDGSNGFTIEDPTGISAIRITSTGDYNADGFSDLALSASGADFNGVDSGRVYVLFGPTSEFPAVLNLATLDASNALVIDGENSDDGLGSAVINAGDINGDGVNDLALSASEASPNGSESGRAYVIFGSASAVPGVFDLNTLNGSNGFAINGEFAGDEFGGSISALGDINSDGLDDLIISAFEADPNGIVDGGRSYVIYGQANLPATQAVPINGVIDLFLLASMLLLMAWFQVGRKRVVESISDQAQDLCAD